MKNLMIILSILLIGCSENKKVKLKKKENKEFIKSYATQWIFPLGGLRARGYYNAQKFTQNNHLGEDWNGIGGGNTDFGDSIQAVANGYVTFAKDLGGGWGNVVRITHYMTDGNQIESFYAHCNETLVKENTWVEMGTNIATVGNCEGMYPAHLHFEMRDKIGLPVGGGYSSETEGYINPTKFINDHKDCIDHIPPKH